jgi:hypothetical protein
MELHTHSIHSIIHHSFHGGSPPAAGCGKARDAVGSCLQALKRYPAWDWITVALELQRSRPRFSSQYIYKIPSQVSRPMLLFTGVKKCPPTI